MDNLIYEIAGIRYLLFAIPVTEKNKDRLDTEVDKYDGIIQGVREWKQGGIFTNPVLILNILIPENGAVEFSKKSRL